MIKNEIPIYWDLVFVHMVALDCLEIACTTTIPLRFPLQGGRFPRAWPQPLPSLALSPGSSAHAPDASLSVQKTSAIPAGVAALSLQSTEFLANLASAVSKI